MRLISWTLQSGSEQIGWVYFCLFYLFNESKAENYFIHYLKVKTFHDGHSLGIKIRKISHRIEKCKLALIKIAPQKLFTENDV
jgi:hypothetical protein